MPPFLSPGPIRRKKGSKRLEWYTPGDLGYFNFDSPGNHAAASMGREDLIEYMRKRRGPDIVRMTFERMWPEENFIKREILGTIRGFLVPIFYGHKPPLKEGRLAKRKAKKRFEGYPVADLLKGTPPEDGATREAMEAMGIRFAGDGKPAEVCPEDTWEGGEPVRVAPARTKYIRRTGDYGDM